MDHSIKTTSLVRMIKRIQDLLREPEYVLMLPHVRIHRDIR